MTDEHARQTPRGLIRDERAQNDYGFAYAVIVVMAFSLSTAAILLFADWGQSIGYSIPEGRLLTGIGIVSGIGVAVAVATYIPSPKQRRHNHD